MKDGNFKINGKSGMDNLHAFLTSYPAIKKPKRKKTLTSITGSNEQIILDENAYDNRDIELDIVVKANNEEERTLHLANLYAQFEQGMYIPFIHYGEPNYEYQVTLDDSVDETRLTRVSYWTEVKLKLSAKAFKYYKPEQSYTFKGNLTLFNKYAFPSKPLIQNVSGSNLNLTINDRKYSFTNLSANSWIDCDESQQDVYDSNNNLINGAYDYKQEFPELPTGNLTINSNNSIIIYPRWRTL